MSAPMHPPYALSGTRVLLPDGGLEQATVEIRDGWISAVVKGPYAAPSDVQVRELTPEHILAPGLIDTHVHGRLGRNAMEATPEALMVIGQELLAAGITAFVAATASVRWPRLLESLGGLREATGPIDRGAEMLGIHMEGPFLSPSRRGVHSKEHLVEPTPSHVQELLDVAGDALKICTLAPEIPGADAAMKVLADRGVAVSIGHTAATFAQTRHAIGHGATRATHLFNAMPPIHHRAPGPIPALLAAHGVHLELVADGVHVDPDLLTVLLRAPELYPRIVLVSDGSDVAGLADGAQRRWEGTRVVLREGRAYTADGTVAGSVATLMDGVRTVVAGGVPVSTALAAASSVPADSLGFSDRGCIEVGRRADLVILDAGLGVEATILLGTDQDKRQK